MQKAIMVVSLLFVIGVGHAQMYQYKDAGGKIYYTDNPAEVQKNKAKVVNEEQLQLINTVPAIQYEDDEYRRNQEAYMQQQQREMAVNRAKNQEHCQKYFHYVKQLKEAPPRLVDINADGTRYYYTDKEIKDYVHNEEMKYQKTCSNL